MNYRAILIVCLATLGLAVAGWGQADGKIAFISDREGHGDVWIMNADGSDPVNLTQGRDCASPAWSPDGTQIAYIAGGEIWLMDAAGSNPQQVTDDAVDKARLFWSEDGSSIYYVAVPTLPIPDEWTPDAFVAELAGSGSSSVDWREVHSRFLPGVSPDGSQKATVTLWDGERGHRHGPRVLRPGEPGTVRPGEPYTAKHRRYEAGRVHALFYIGTSASDHMHSGDLLPESLQNKMIYTEPYEEWRTYPTWSPDGMRIAFASFLDFMGQFEIWAADTDGDNWIELTNGLGGREPAWQPVVPSATATSVESQSWGQVKLKGATL